MSRRQELDFLAEDNVAGVTLLHLVARGSAIVAELLRLSDHIPPVFLGTDASETERYAPILLDFKYLKTPEYFDEEIDRNVDVVEMDEEFRENHLTLLGRFYKMFESIYIYQRDFNTYVEELVEGVFVEHTLEGVLQDPEGKQLMCEAIYLYGVMLLLMDLQIPGSTRERMIISYYRYKGAATVNNMDEVCRLCRHTGFEPGQKRPENYPELLFERYRMNEDVIDMVIGKLRSDDIYNRMAAFPAPRHRSTALASQSAMLYVILYFAPRLLRKKAPVMREIVDKHFNDNWVVPFYMGFTVDLGEMWRPYPAASAALQNILEKSNVEEVLERHVEILPQLRDKLDHLLTEGVLEEEYVLDNIRKLIHHARCCNHTLRWFILHRTTRHKRYSEAIRGAVNVVEVLKLLMSTAQFEFILKEMFTGLLATKQQRWEECKTEARDRMVELSEYFSGEKALTRVSKNAKLQGWFKSLADEIEGLDYSNVTIAGRKIQSLLNALEEVEEFHQIETSLQVKTFLADTRVYLNKMVRTVNVRYKVLADLDIISDLGYAWHIIANYTELIHAHIKEDPSIVLMLRATFLKLSSILNLPLVRISQCQSKDEVSVAEFFSSKLVAYVRGVLDVIPRSVFAILDEITQLQTDALRPIPTKIERTQLKEYAQLSHRYTLARATHQVSVFTQGILAMKTTLVGIIKLDPKQLLEDGIRKQLVTQLCHAMNGHLVFKTGSLEDFEARLVALGRKLGGIRMSVEYIQDYINMYGLKIWQEEMSRIMNYYVEQESNSFLKHKVYDWQSAYQDDAIRIPRFPRPQIKTNNQQGSVNFMGRLVRELLQQTDSRSTTYVQSLQGWYDNASHKEVVGIRTFDLLNRGVGVFGLTGMDKLTSFMIVRDLRAFVRAYRKLVDSNMRKLVNRLANKLRPTAQFPPEPVKLYRAHVDQTKALWPVFLQFATKIGQAQLVRMQISNELNFSCKMDSKILCSSLEVLNQALLDDVRSHYAKPESKPMPGNTVLTDISEYLETAGINNPITKIYITCEPMEGIPELMFLFVLSQVTRLKWNSRLSTLVAASKNDPVDGAPLVIGVITILKQFHSSYTQHFIAYMGQFVRSYVSAAPGKSSTFPPIVTNSLLFLEEFCRFSNTSRSVIEKHIPSYIFDRFTR